MSGTETKYKIEMEKKIKTATTACDVSITTCTVHQLCCPLCTAPLAPAFVDASHSNWEHLFGIQITTHRHTEQGIFSIRSRATINNKWKQIFSIKQPATRMGAALGPSTNTQSVLHIGPHSFHLQTRRAIHTHTTCARSITATNAGLIEKRQELFCLFDSVWPTLLSHYLLKSIKAGL